MTLTLTVVQDFNNLS